MSVITNAHALPSTVRCPEEALTDKEYHKGPQKKDGDRIAYDPVCDLFPTRRRQEFFNRHQPDIADTASIKISDGLVMNGMGPAPLLKRSEVHNACNVAQDPVRPSGGEERPVTAIVKENEDAYLEACRKHRNGQDDPIRRALPVHPYHESPEQKEGDKGLNDLEDRLSGNGLRVGGESFWKVFGAS